MTISRVKEDGSESRVMTRVIPAIFPHSERSFSFMLSPRKMREKAGTEGRLAIDITGDDSVKLHWPHKDGSGKLPDDSMPKNGGSGCDVGGGFVGLCALALLATVRKKQGKC